MTFVISNEEVDRHGDVVLAQGWRLQAYLQQSRSSCGPTTTRGR